MYLMGAEERGNFKDLIGAKVLKSRASSVAIAADESVDFEASLKASEIAEPTIHTYFADTALWVATLTTDVDGIAEVFLTMPENLTGWKIKTWAMGHGAKVGEGEAQRAAVTHAGTSLFHGDG